MLIKNNRYASVIKGKFCHPWLVKIFAQISSFKPNDSSHI